MAQCKKVLDNGQRCSNPATPGSDYCDSHRRTRIQFHKVPAPPPPAEPQPEPAKKPRPAEKPVPPPTWVAGPAGGDTPAFPGLRRDARGILVAPQGLIWLNAAADEQHPDPFPTRLERLLAGLSQVMPLPGQVTLRLTPDQSGALVGLAPSAGGDLSRLYDAAAAAAAFNGGLLYIGQEPAFIQFRDGYAPPGYDAAGVTPPAGDMLYLIDRMGTHPVARTTLKEAPLDRFLLGMTPMPERAAELPETIYVLAVPALYRLLARYFQAHELPYQVARGQREQTMLLFRVTARSAAPAGSPLPAFVLNYLESLPRAVVLTEAAAEAGRRLLVQWRYRHPCRAEHILEAFPADSLMIAATAGDFKNLHFSPAPTFFDGAELARVEPRRLFQLNLTPLHTAQDLPLTVPLRLTSVPGPTPPTAALLLDKRELSWLRRLLYRLPGPAFGAYQLCIGQEQAILLAETQSITDLPLGLPLRRVQDTSLYIPLRAGFSPNLPWSLLAQALGLTPPTLTFLTPDFRLDVPRSGFVSLTRALVAEPGRPRLTFQVQPVPALPPLAWTPPKTTAPVTPPQETSKTPGLFDQLLGRGAKTPPPKTAPSSAGPSPQPQALDASTALREQAQAYQQEGDWFNAAACYTLLGDSLNAGRCFQAAAAAAA